MRKNVWISDELYKKVSEKLRKDGKSFSSLIKECMERYISEGETLSRQTAGDAIPLSPSSEEEVGEEKPKLPTWHGDRKRVQELIRKGKIPKELREKAVKEWIERWKDLPLEDLLIEYRDAKFNIQCEAVERILRDRGEDVSILCNYDRDRGEEVGS